MKKRIHLFWASLILISSCLYAQADKEQTTVPPLKEQHNIFVNPISKFLVFSMLGYSYERPLTDKWVLNISPSIGAVPLLLLLSPNNPITVAISTSILNANISVAGRYYFNRLKRMQKGKPLSLNTGNFIGATTSYSHIFVRNSSLSIASALDGAVFWGLRSNLGGKFFFGLELGINCSLLFIGEARRPTPIILPHIVVQFAYVLNSIKK